MGRNVSEQSCFASSINCFFNAGNGRLNCLAKSPELGAWIWSISGSSFAHSVASCGDSDGCLLGSK